MRPTRAPVRCVHVVWRLSRHGGVPRVVRQLLAGHDPSAVESHVISVRPALEMDGLDELPNVAFHFAGYEERLRVRDRLRVMRYVADVIRTLQPDIVHTHGGTATLAAAGLRVAPSRWILDVHDAPGRGRIGWKTEWVEGRLCRNPRFTVVAHSRSVRDEVHAKYRIPFERNELIPLGIDVGAYARMATPVDVWRTRHHLDHDAVLALYVTRLAPLKNVDLFLDVARAIVNRSPRRSVQFAVVGVGSELSRLRARTTRLGLDGTVRFLESLPDQDLINALHSSDLFVSTSDYEGFGLAVAEAMAAGRPVVATAVGGHFDLVEEKRTGLLAPVGDAAGLADAVDALVEDADTRTSMGAAAAEKARAEFAADTMVSRYEDLYERLAGRDSARNPASESEPNP